MMEPVKEKIIEHAKSLGADFVGFAPVARWAEFNEVQNDFRPDAIWPQAKTVIVIGVPMLLPILETTPSIYYSELYNTSNRLLDEIGYRLSMYLNRHGNAATFFPRDAYGDIKVLVDNPNAAFSHVFAAKYAGLGTIGYNHTLLNPEYGPRIRYVSVFTAALLPGDPVITKDLCIQCRLCQRLCPSQAFTTREDNIIAAMDKEACARHHSLLREEHRYPCGICIKVCPVGKDRKLYQSTGGKVYLDEPGAIAENPEDPRYRNLVHIRRYGSKGDRIY
jgi:epoxyqueuosine reductase QueG